jgi:hypothetical protein
MRTVKIASAQTGLHPQTFAAAVLPLNHLEFPFAFRFTFARYQTEYKGKCVDAELEPRCTISRSDPMAGMRRYEQLG